MLSIAAVEVGCNRARGCGVIVGQLRHDGWERVQRTTVHLEENRVEWKPEYRLQALQRDVQWDELEDVDGDFEQKDRGRSIARRVTGGSTSRRCGRIGG